MPRQTKRHSSYHTIPALIKYHGQDDPCACGWTVAQMLLNSFSKTDAEYIVTQGAVDQDLEYWNWYTEPDHLRRVLTNNQPLENRADFSLFTYDNEPEASQLIATAICEKNIPACAVVWDFYHWVIVYGCDATKNNKTGVYNIEALYLYDPLPGPAPGDTSRTINTRHDDNDHCGEGGKNGIAHVWVSYPHWRQVWLTGITRHIRPDYYDQFVVVTLTGADSNVQVPSNNEPPAQPQCNPPVNEKDPTTQSAVKKAAVEGLLGKLVSRPENIYPWYRLGTNLTAVAAHFVSNDYAYTTSGFCYWLVEISPTS